MNQFIFETLNFLFCSLFGEEYLYHLLHFMISLESHELYMEYINYADTYHWEVYLEIIELEETGKYIYIIIFHNSSSSSPTPF